MFKTAVFDTKPFIHDVFVRCTPTDVELTFFEHRLSPDTVMSAQGYNAVCVFVNDILNGDVIRQLAQMGVGLIALRCAGYNNVDLHACEAHGIRVVRVPSYSPPSIAEHAVMLMLALNRRITRAHARVREGNFSLEGLVGFEMHGKTVGIIGTGRIGKCAAEIMLGFGCSVLAYDPYPNAELAARPGLEYVSLEQILEKSHIISLHVPLIPDTHHLINKGTIEKMMPGVMLINTSRGALIDTQALILGLKSGKIGSAGLDVYEEEGDYFFEDFSDTIITDDTLARLLTFNNVLVTSHQAFLTREALQSIAETTLESIQVFAEKKYDGLLPNQVCSRCGT